ncbi:MAG: pyruvate formate-lyase-activating protein [Planctomycetota bacterium]
MKPPSDPASADPLNDDPTTPTSLPVIQTEATPGGGSRPGAGLSSRAGGGAGMGWVHSHENASTVDGPGFRYVVWLAGCHLRCQYCHNPDTWAVNHGTRQTAGEVIRDVARFATFLKATGGGFTVSGGEPLAQAPFALELMRHAKSELGLHTALDTNGYLGDRLTDDDLDAIDLMLLDLKAFSPEHHRTVTGFDNADILAFARRLAERGRPTWVRYVLVPGLTDGADDIAALAEFVAPMANVERVEVLPFHQMGRDKWRELGQAYPLEATPAATVDQAEQARAIFRQAGCRVE